MRVIAPIPRLASRQAQRSFSCSRISKATKDEPDKIEDVSKDTSNHMSQNASAHSHRKAFVKWLSTKGRYLEENRKQGTNYIDGKDHPFPLNPFFRPSPPLNADVKSTMHQQWTNGKSLRQLSQEHDISLARVEAILRLQEIKLDLQKQVRTYDSGLDRMMLDD